MKKNRLYHGLCALFFLVLFIVCFRRASEILRYKVFVNDTVGSFYKEEKDSIDVIILGSSHAYHGFSPMEIWKESGITSYNLATSSQTFPCSYYLLKDALRLQRPKLVVLEVLGAKYDEDFVSPERLHQALDGMPFNKTKLEVFRELLPRSLSLSGIAEFVFPMLKYHSRWTELKESDFQPYNLWRRGFSFSYRVHKQKKPKLETETEPLSESAMEYFEKIVALCQENQIPLLLVQTPSGENEEYTRTHRRTNTLKEYAKNEGMRFLDFDRIRKRAGVDFAKDFLDETHLNVNGGLKISRYTAKYIMKYYDLADHRGDPAYESWDEDLKEYQAYIEEKKAD